MLYSLQIGCYYNYVLYKGYFVFEHCNGVTPEARWMVWAMQANFALARETKPQKSVCPDEGMKRGDRSASIHISFLHCSSLLINSNDTYTAARFRLPPPFSDGIFPHPVHACTYRKQELFRFIDQGVEGIF
jgi:hypothetical protein